MSRLQEQTLALINKELILLKRSKNYLLQELVGPLIGVYFIWYGRTLSKTSAVNFAFFAIPVFLSRPMYTMVFNIVFEKSQNYKEYLRVNGASLYSYMLSSFIFNIVRCFIAVGILFTGLYLLDGGLENPALILLNLMVYAVALTNFHLAFSTLFNEPKLATEIISLFLVLLSFIYLAVTQSSEQYIYYLGSLFPPIACLLGFPVSGPKINNPANFTEMQAFLMQVVNCFLYFLLYGYLDRVVPSDSGIKDPLFKCMKRADKSARGENELPVMDLESGNREQPLLINAENGDDADDVSSAQYHENFYNPNKLKRTVFVDNLTRVFGDHVAVDRVSLPMFEKQVFCLLGHNGAGKTTTINMMTGLLRPNEGSIFYDGLDFADHFETIRAKFGLCVQKDLLYENLTAAEHIELILRLRGVSLVAVPAYIEALSRKVGIVDELSKKSTELSGGNKRKLSLALAIAGETRVLFLDEPTSGLDPNARREFWDLIRALRDEGKTILLTTHNLDEADELADRIGIMSKGRLLILGTSNFLKKKYGVGYNLILTPKPNSTGQFQEIKKHLTEQVFKIIQSSEVDSKTSGDVLKITLPYGESPKFAELFKVLESEPSIEIALELNTLEDVFVNIGHQEERDEALHSGRNPNESEGGSSNGQFVPPSINQESTYNFKLQVQAMFKRKFFHILRNKTSQMQVFIPMLSILISNVILASSIKGAGAMADVQMLMFTFVSLSGFLSSTVFYTGFLVGEKEQNVKYLLRTFGVRAFAYLIGSLLFDFVLVSLFSVTLLPVGFFFDVKSVAANPLMFLLLVLSFGFAVLNQSYLFTRIYDKQATVYKFHPVLTTFGLLFLPMLVIAGIATLLSSRGSIELIIIIAIVIAFLASPPIFFIASALSFSSWDINVGAFGSLFRNPYFYLGMMSLQGLFYFVLTLRAEIKSLSLEAKPPKELRPHIAMDHIPNPHEIQGEEERVKSAENRDPTKTIDITKAYDNGFQALRGITFGVEKGQIFGLLGPNGAGKSTTFNILTGLVPKTSGRVFFNNHELETLDPTIFQNTGICPQFNALWDDLSVAEHLEICGMVKGLSKQTIEESIMFYARILRIEEHLHKKASELSGGTKRKVCVANMLIGAPTVQFLDEPSTGLDPLSKRSLYDTIINNLEDRKASIILTTHSMSEAEALCTKIGILINGKFVCLGPLPYLKSRYGTGYKISVLRMDSNLGVAEQKIFETFPSAVKEDGHSDVFNNYRVPTENFSFERAFTVMENLKNENVVSDFNIINTTLEQVFIQFSRNQIQNLEIVANSS